MVKVEPPPKIEYIVPILELDMYLWLHERHGASPERIDYLRRKNTRGDPLNRVVTYMEPVYMTQSEFMDQKKPLVTRIPVRHVNDVVFSFTVVNDRVLVNVCAPFDPAFTYIRRGQRVPKETQYECLKRCGVAPGDVKKFKNQLKLILSRPVFKAVKKM
jgi:hypothetical protein